MISLIHDIIAIAAGGPQNYYSMSACANLAPKRGRYSAFHSRFVCIAPRAVLSNASSEEFDKTVLRLL
jgi:hypothetical protein